VIDFSEPPATGVAAQVAGLIRKYKGHFILSKDCRKLLAAKGLTGIYPRLGVDSGPNLLRFPGA
jgi:hypothetical protein